MKLSTIIRAIVRPIVQIDVTNNMFRCVAAKYNIGACAMVVDDYTSIARGLDIMPYPRRAREWQVGHLTVAWWGRDTLVHPVPEAS